MDSLGCNWPRGHGLEMCHFPASGDRELNVIPFSLKTKSLNILETEILKFSVLLRQAHTQRKSKPEEMISNNKNKSKHRLEPTMISVLLVCQTQLYFNYQSSVIQQATPQFCGLYPFILLTSFVGQERGEVSIACFTSNPRRSTGVAGSTSI